MTTLIMGRGIRAAPSEPNRRHPIDQHLPSNRVRWARFNSR
jgi:hypothetical protein